MVEDTEEMRKWRGLKSERNGLVLEEFGGKNERGSSGQLLGRRKQKERPSEVEVPLTGMEDGAQKQNIQNKKVVEKIAGQEFSFRLENTTCSFRRASRRSQRKKKR